MKQILLIIAITAGSVSLNAQTLEEAKQQLYYQRFESAEKTLQDFLKQQPQHAEARYLLTRAHLLQDETSSATNTLLNVPAPINSQPFYQVAYGQLLLSVDKKDSAAIYFNEALSRTKEKDASILTAVALAHIDAKDGDGNYAVALLNKALKRDKHNAMLYVLMGDAYKKLRNGSEAYNAYKKAFEENKNLAAAYFSMGEIFAGQKNAELLLEYYNKAIAADPDFAPAYYKLYSHYFYNDPAKALDYYNQYVAKSDANPEQAYELADLYYLNRQYDKAIQQASGIVNNKTAEARPRIYKLLAYSYADTKDSTASLQWMRQYFANEEDSNLIAKDFDLMASLYTAGDLSDSAFVFYEKATYRVSDSATLRQYFKKLATLASDKKDYASQGKWLGSYYNGNEQATNLDLFNWGLAHFRAEDYAMADSVFGMYVLKYPGQSFGYYWQARSNAMLDKEMESGRAIPFYQKLVEVLQKDTANANYKTWLSQAYGYLAAYEANTEKDYPEAIDYFEKVLEVDPQNADARKYIDVLEKRLAEDDKNGK